MKAKGNTNDLERSEEISEKEVQKYIIKSEIKFFLLMKKFGFAQIYHKKKLTEFIQNDSTKMKHNATFLS